MGTQTGARHRSLPLPWVPLSWDPRVGVLKRVGSPNSGGSPEVSNGGVRPASGNSSPTPCIGGRPGGSASGEPPRVGPGSWAGLPHPPLSGADPRGLLILPKSGPKRAEFLRIFDPCGATPWGGGGAPPTTLILLRNQPESRRRARHPRPPPGRPPSAQLGPARLPNPRKKSFFFFSSC